MDDFKSIIGKVATGATLSRDEAASAFDAMMSGEATPSQMGGLLMALRVRGETVDEITGAVAAMRAKMLRVKAPAEAIDVVGTGGDGSGSVNVSTCASFIDAGARDDKGSAGRDVDRTGAVAAGADHVDGVGGRLDPQHLAAHRRDRAGDLVDGFAAHPERHQQPAHLRGRGLAGHHAVEGGGRFLTRQRRAGGDFSDDGFEVVHRVPSESREPHGEGAPLRRLEP